MSGEKELKNNFKNEAYSLFIFILTFLFVHKLVKVFFQQIFKIYTKLEFV